MHKKKLKSLFCLNRIIKSKQYWLIPITGLLALTWFLFRVIPKPTRATYPCQRLALPLALGSLAGIAGFFATCWLYLKTNRVFMRFFYILTLFLCFLTLFSSVSINQENTLSLLAYEPTDPPNQPIGTGKGVNPGRVVWVHDTDSVTWNGSSGNWWAENNIHQDVVDRMFSNSIQWLTGENTDADSWDALFRYFNETHNNGNVGYKQGEKIAIKLNQVQDNQNNPNWSNKSHLSTPQFVFSLVNQLVNTVGVSDSDIVIYDASRYIGNPIYNKINKQFNNVVFVVSPDLAKNGRVAAQPNKNHPVYFADPKVSGSGKTYFPKKIIAAKYLINIAKFKGHNSAGVTLCAKNYFGSVADNNNWSPRHLHPSISARNRKMGSPNVLVELLGHEHLGGKELLFIIDAFMGSVKQGSEPVRFNSFNNDWCESIFVSQDPVAIDSVALDFLRNESKLNQQIEGAVDNYLHEAALAHNPPSGAFYDPENDGSRLESLGVHEHWNNAVDKKYSRNLGTGNGIELISSEPSGLKKPIANAGPDQVVVDSDNNGSETISLSGSGSHDPDGVIIDYIWMNGSVTIASGVSADVSLPTGTHNITLQVEDNDNLTDTDQIMVTVNAVGDDDDDDDNHPDNAVRLWPDKDYKGNAAFFTVGSYNQAAMVAAGMKNNDAHSIKVLPGYEATVYTGSNLDGSSKVFTVDAPRLGGQFSNQVSSLKVEYLGDDDDDNDDDDNDNNHPDNAVRLWANADYKGTRALFTVGDYNQAALVAAGMNNNDAHSIKVLPGYEATVYTGSNFDGSSKVFTVDAPRLGGQFSNQVSSIKVRYIGN